ncbi:hypothetical protein J3R83DRAFT_744 [Lanmaoa asiatica]|nr:hypothetical protein J3R83DRAFT_744 [Lanmaoa asiatica]
MHSTCYHPNNDLIHRRTHRKRFSVSKSSSETVQTLPEYSSPPGWSNSVGPPPLTEAESDRPPDYPETADEADADTEGGQEEHIVYVQHHLVLPPSRRSPTHIRRRKRVPAAASDPFLDTLLERSVHALETSNALLRTTMSTQSSLSTLISSENESDHFLEVRARNLSTRIKVSSGVHETWMDHLEEISEGVDKLFGDEGRCLSASHLDEGAVSRSLPTTTVPDLRHRRKPSILELNGSSNSHLRYSHPTRDVLVAPAPRALTQYVESTADPQLITLPSTLGLRASGSSHSVHSRRSLSAHHQEAQPPSTAGILPQTQEESTTPAYHFLSNLVKRSASLTPPSSTRLLRSRDRCASASPTGTMRGTKSLFSSSSMRTLYPSPARSRSGIQAQTSKSRSEAPRRPSTPPTPLPTMLADEELSPSSSESSDRPTGYRTVQSLRKIIGNHPSSTSVNTLQRKDPKLNRTPFLLPITPPPAPIQSTSTATASISRLYTKGRHSMSTRPPSPPAHSSLRVRLVPPTPSPSPSTMSLSEAFGNGVARVMGSASSSGVSTPKRISFAKLPESYSGSQSGTSRLRERKSRKKNKQVKGVDKEGAGGWLRTLLSGGLSSGGLAGMGSREERMEERMARGWGSRPGYGTLDDWAV